LDRLGNVFDDHIKKDILKWTQETPTWIQVSQTPELTKFHALSFTGKIHKKYFK